MEKIERADRLLLALILIVLAAWIYLLPPIWNHGEAREGLVVRSIVLDHQWILPFRNDEVPSKPPLFHWIGASLAHLFGLSDFTVRLPSVLAAWIVALITFVLGAAIGGRKTAWLAVGALLGMYQFWVSATEARVDMVFSACVTISIAGFFFWQRDGREGGRTLSYLAAACAVLAKGPVGAALPGIVIVSFLVVERRFAAIWQFISWPLLALALAIDLGWYALAYRIGGSEFVAWQIMHENVDQLLGTHGFESNKTTLSMLGWIPTRTFPWNLALLWVLVRRLRGERQDSTGRFLVVWWAAITAFFFLVNIKRAVYLLPTYPAVALLAARALATIMDRAGAAGSDSAGITSAQLRWWQRAFCTPGRAALAVALVDLALILPNPMIWKRSASYKTRLAFIDGIGAQVPPGTPLYAGPKLGESDLLIIAYRTRRTIARKPIACARPNEYFLSGMKPSDFDGVKIRRLAASEKNNVALAIVLAPPPGKPCSSETPKHEDDSDTE